MTSTDLISPAVPEPAAALDTTAAEIDLMSMSERREVLRSLGDHHGAALGAADSWRRLEGVVAFFEEADLGEPGSWISRVNATVIEAVQRGIVLAADPAADDFGNPGSRAWADYLAVVTGGAPEPNAAARAWSWARRVAIDHGKRWAAAHGTTPSPVQARFLMLADLGSLAVAHRTVMDAVLAYAGLLGPSLADIDPAVVDRLCDPADVDAARRACKIAYAAAIFEPRATCHAQEHRLVPMVRGLLDMLAGHS
ncbi:hypothetical protein DFR70_12618 [Nocardia tenerifensis]|uniref:Uncharacterized protein n=1 Tax=Nocardia tenerifensis TaxID=228006 RepID=A0A318JNW7_9NOCA|nr:hypothetical protein [Nocardia tenerifensis]PXX53897.1 hypothetical protein DFR70_12618 [Nocardia tenerifensis]